MASCMINIQSEFLISKGSWVLGSWKMSILDKINSVKDEINPKGVRFDCITLLEKKIHVFLPCLLPPFKDETLKLSLFINYSLLFHFCLQERSKIVNAWKKNNPLFKRAHAIFINQKPVETLNPTYRQHNISGHVPFFTDKKKSSYVHRGGGELGIQWMEGREVGWLVFKWRSLFCPTT